MTSQQSHKALHTKILDVFRSKSLKKNVKDPRQTLFFKIKPQKSVSQLLIPYRDLKDNFPYALIEYYENKIKIKIQNAKSFQHLLSESEKNTEKLKNSIIEEKKENKKSQSKQKQKNQKAHQQEQKPQIDNIEQQQNPNQMPILDYDYYMQEHDIPITKIFHAMFSQTEPNESNFYIKNTDRYLKDLNNDENNMYARKNSTNSPNYQMRRKKARIDYHE